MGDGMQFPFEFSILQETLLKCKKPNGFFISVSFIAFGDIARNAYSRSSNLIPEAEIMLERALVG